MSILTRARNFLADLFTVAHEPDWGIEVEEHIMLPSLSRLMIQLGYLVQAHSAAGIPEIYIVVNDGDAMRSIVARINDHWAYPVVTPEEVRAAQFDDIVKIDADAEFQCAQLAGVKIYWPLPGQTFEAA